MKKIIFCFCSLLVLSSCNHTFKEYNKESFPTYSWASDQSVKFTPEIKDLSKTYKLSVGLRHAYGMQVPRLGIEIEFVSPSGKKNIRKYEIQLMNNQGEYISSCGGDLCDIEKTVEENVKFDEAGIYNYSIRHTMPVGRLAGIMEVGLIIDEQ